MAEPAADGTHTAPIGELRERMGALSVDEATFVGTVLADMPSRPSNYEEAVVINLGRNPVDDEPSAAGGDRR